MVSVVSNETLILFRIANKYRFYHQFQFFPWYMHMPHLIWCSKLRVTAMGNETTLTKTTRKRFWLKVWWFNQVLDFY
jgi:hypothetical protein